MTTLGTVEAKAHFSELLERASGGENFIITKRGIPLVRLVPYGRKTESEILDLIDELKEFRSTVKPALKEGETWNELARSGTKW
jgi:prevent-host-death family protein